jgi:ATP-binding cassette subfamily B protein
VTTTSGPRHRRRPSRHGVAPSTGRRPGGTFRQRLRDWVSAPDRSAEDVIAQAPRVPVREVFRRFWPYARRRWRWLVVAFAITAAVPAVEAIEIWLFKVVIDDVLVPRDFALFPEIAVLYVVLTLVSGVLSFCDDVLSAWLSQRFLLDLRTDVFRHLQRLSLHLYERMRVGDLLSRLSGDISAIEGFLVSGLTSFVSYAVQIVVFAGALFYLQWQLALASLLIAPVFWRVAQRFARMIKEVSRERRRRAGSMNAMAEESLGNVMLVQAYNRQDREISRFQKQGESQYEATMAATRLGALYSPFIDAIELAGALIVLGFGTYLLSRNELTLGELLVFITFLTRLFGPVRGLSRLVTSAYSASAAAERVIEVLDERPGITDSPDAVRLDRARGEVEFDSVLFRYPERSATALDGVSFTVRPGEVLALVGPSGAGKSTVTKLLLRFYDPDEGRVLLDGTDLRDLEVASLRDNVALVLQETLVFDGSVRDNIAFGRPGAGEEEIVAAARAADAHEFILALEDGYDTRLGERGRRLSGGQRQRIAIARAMVRDAPVLVLDEPTTGLDTESGQRIMEPLRRLMAGRTTIVISHNLLLVREASRIVLLERGRVVESGSHGELLARGGRYAALSRLAGLEQALDGRPEEVPL